MGMTPLDWIVEQSCADNVETAIDIIADTLRHKRKEFRRLLREEGDGNVYFYLDDVEKCEVILEKLSDLLGEILLCFGPTYQAPSEDDEEDDRSPAELATWAAIQSWNE